MTDLEDVRVALQSVIASLGALTAHLGATGVIDRSMAETINDALISADALIQETTWFVCTTSRSATARSSTANPPGTGTTNAAPSSPQAGSTGSSPS